MRNAIDSTVLRSGTAKRPTGERRLQGLHRGEVKDVQSGSAYFILPRITGSQVHGPYPVLPVGVVAGDRVLVGAIDGRMDDLIVMHIL